MAQHYSNLETIKNIFSIPLEYSKVIDDVDSLGKIKADRYQKILSNDYFVCYDVYPSNPLKSLLGYSVANCCDTDEVEEYMLGLLTPIMTDDFTVDSLNHVIIDGMRGLEVYAPMRLGEEDKYLYVVYITDEENAFFVFAISDADVEDSLDEFSFAVRSFHRLNRVTVTFNSQDVSSEHDHECECNHEHEHDHEHEHEHEHECGDECDHDLENNIEDHFAQKKIKFIMDNLAEEIGTADQELEAMIIINDLKFDNDGYEFLLRNVYVDDYIDVDFVTYYPNIDINDVFLKIKSELTDLKDIDTISITIIDKTITSLTLYPEDQDSE